MELRQLRAFLEVARQGHFGRAAGRLNLTQPALTQRIQALERELGVQVFERSAREVHLTDAGRLLLPYARSMVQNEEAATRSLRDQAAGLVQAIVRLAGTLALETIAEGVERPDQLQSLRELGCQQIQGFYFSKPLSPDDVENFLRQQPTHPPKALAVNADRSAVVT